MGDAKWAPRLKVCYRTIQRSCRDGANSSSDAARRSFSAGERHCPAVPGAHRPAVASAKAGRSRRSSSPQPACPPKPWRRPAILPFVAARPERASVEGSLQPSVAGVDSAVGPRSGRGDGRCGLTERGQPQGLPLHEYCSLSDQHYSSPASLYSRQHQLYSFPPSLSSLHPRTAAPPGKTARIPSPVVSLFAKTRPENSEYSGFMPLNWASCAVCTVRRATK